MAGHPQETVVASVVEAQRSFYRSGVTRDPEFRRRALLKLRNAIRANGAAIEEALLTDLNKSPFEAYMTETGIVLSELSLHLKNIRKWSRPRRVPSPLALQPARSYVMPEPYGVVLIMAPWNYPVQLCLNPLIGALAAGNCVVLKPSAYAPATSRLIAELLGKIFPREYVAVVEGGREANSALLEQKFDYIFFTGSVQVGRVVMRAAAERLTPLTLELGGKSPTIIDATADVPMAARRIAFGKLLNAGQTCVAPDYVLISRAKKAEFVEAFRAALVDFSPDGNWDDYPRIISQRHYERLLGLLENQELLLGGLADPERLMIEPTLLNEPALDSPVMQEEIFGPILPIISFDELDEAIDLVNSRPRPLALYLFTSDRSAETKVLRSCSFGGGCVNDTIMHLANPYLPFGGIGDSGLGAYHGKRSFDTFSHERSVLRQSRRIDLPVRYRPYKEKWLRVLKRLMR